MSRIYESEDSKYATTCSDVTLCSNTKGFFKNLVEELVSLASEQWLKTLEKLEDEKKIAAVLENDELMEALKEVLARIKPLYRGKDANVSSERRKASQMALSAGDLPKALALASQAVLRSPMTGSVEAVDGGVSLAMALWVRSEVLLATGRAQAALEDLKLALKERLPAKMRGQYYWRMGHCYRDAGEPHRAKVSYELAGRLLGNNEKAKEELTKDIESLDYTALIKHPPDKSSISVTGGSKQNIPSMSNLLKIVEEEGKGRFAVADSHIKTGDVLLVDAPYAACLLADYYGTHCLHCFRRLEDCSDSAPVWCSKCSGVAFCSLKCRDLAVSTYHTFECPFLDLFLGSGMSILSHIALRMVTQAGLDTSLDIHSKYLLNEIRTIEGAVLNDIEGVSKKSKIKSRRERLNRAKKGQKILTEKNVKEDVVEEKENAISFEEKLELKAAQIYSLCTHSEMRKGEDILQRIIMATFLTECLKKGGFFENCDQENALKAHTSICGLIVKNLQLLQFNAHEIYETLRGEHRFSGSKPVYIAVGIYSTGALFNHECYPAVARYFDGRNIILRSIRPLAPGDVISENYGPHFMTRNLKERRRALACRYWFRCECVACTEDWPTLKEMSCNIPPNLRCHNMSCSAKIRANLQHLPERCYKCSTPINKELVKINVETVDMCTARYQDGAKLMENEDPSGAISVMSAAIDTFHEIARGPHRETHLAQEALRSCYADFGNVTIVKTENAEKDKKQN